jgi:hypothetical protein
MNEMWLGRDGGIILRGEDRGIRSTKKKTFKIKILQYTSITSAVMTNSMRARLKKKPSDSAVTITMSARSGKAGSVCWPCLMKRDFNIKVYIYYSPCASPSFVKPVRGRNVPVWMCTLNWITAEVCSTFMQRQRRKCGRVKKLQQRIILKFHV